MAKKAKGKKPTFFADPQVDKLMAIVMALAGEVSVLRERLDTVERLAESKLWLLSPGFRSWWADDEAVSGV